MWRTILQRALLVIPQVIILGVLIFLLTQAMPGDPSTGLINPNQDPAVIEQMRQVAGLNDPWCVQYFRWTGNVLQGDFGQSFLYKHFVADLIDERIINTLYLSILTVVLTYLIAVSLGMLAGRYQNSILDKIVVIYNFFSFVVPLFIFGSIVLFVFGYRLGWFPAGGSQTLGLQGGFITQWINRLKYILLPSTTQVFLATAVTIQYLRNEVIDSKSLDFVRTIHSKEVPTNKVSSRHIFRDAALPMASQMGYGITSLVAGSVVIEKIFGYPGVRKLFTDSIDQRDYAVITSLVLILGIATLVGTLLSGIIMSIVDPRIRIQ